MWKVVLDFAQTAALIVAGVVVIMVIVYSLLFLRALVKSLEDAENENRKHWRK
jgi:hypothetical protein